MPMEDTYGIQSRIGSIIVVERWYCCRGSPVFSDRNIHRNKSFGLTGFTKLPDDRRILYMRLTVLQDIQDHICVNQ